MSSPILDRYDLVNRIVEICTSPPFNDREEAKRQLSEAGDLIDAYTNQEVVKELKNLRDSEIANVSIRSLQVRINGRIKILTKKEEQINE